MNIKEIYKECEQNMTSADMSLLVWELLPLMRAKAVREYLDAGEFAQFFDKFRGEKKHKKIPQ